jgi:hypothetical protein
VADVPYFIVGIVLIPSVMYLTVKWKRDSDRKSTAYRLVFPSDLSTEQVVEWLCAISGSMRSQGITAIPSIVFELWSDEKGITHRLKVPWQDDDIIIQLRSHLPGVHVVPDDCPPALGCLWAEGLMLSQPSRTA